MRLGLPLFGFERCGVSTVGGGPAAVPVNTEAPGMLRRASSDVFDINVGVWTNSPTSYIVKVFRDGAEISSVTLTAPTVDTTYTAVTADVGHVLTVRAYAVNAATSALGASGMISGGTYIDALVPPGAVGALSGSIGVLSGTSNLTALGAVDWAKFETLTLTVRKLTGGAQITYSAIGTNGNDATTLGVSHTWTDGDPTVSGTSSIGIASASNVAGTGFRIVIPISTNTRTGSIDITAFSTAYTITATLSDGSAAAYSSGVVDTGASTAQRRRFNFSGNAAAPGQTLTIDIQTNAARITGNLHLMAAFIGA